ncbi:hypothetical protein H0Z60_09575 [Ectothiorhodospiraceae bacterium WFHF3C12]|nr:hypothetical protein [Ectothiorhodospiraceae bacterium WFHF3C12]
MTRFLGLGALFLGLSLSAAANAVSIGNVVPFEPASVTAPETLNRDGRIRAIVQAFVVRSWRVTGIDRESGHVDAEYPIRVHVARVRAMLEDGRVTFHYRPSKEIDHGWRVRRRETTHAGREQFLSSGTDVEGWYLADSPSGPNSTEMVHPKYLEWVQEVSRTLEGTFRLATLPGS